MAVRSAPVLIEAEAISKRYPSRPVTIFPPVRSIFEGRRSSEREPSRSPADSFTAADYDLVLEAAEDEDDDDEEDDDLEETTIHAPPRPGTRPDEMFWALRDVTLRVAPGAAVGVVGGPGSGKSTLLRILAGRAFPTEGRVVVRGRVAPLAADVRKGLGLTAKAGRLDVVLAGRLLGIDARVMSHHRAEIEELAAPLLTADGDPAPGAAVRLAFATTVVLPSDVILLDDPRGLDDAFAVALVARLREHLDRGGALVLATRDESLAGELCGELISLGDGLASAGANGTEPRKGRAASGRKAVAPFNESAALLSAEVRSAAGARVKRFGAHDDLTVEIRIETATPDAEVRCGVLFAPRSGAPGFRVELPEPLRAPRPRAHLLLARIPAGTLPNEAYNVSADASVSSAAAPEASVIARAAGRARIEGNEAGFVERAEPPQACWDGSSAWLVEAEWSVRDERRGR